MELHVDLIKVRTERRRRGWSQEHLAFLSGLGTRTVQRIESTGVASAESAKALAATLELPLDQLTELPVPELAQSVHNRKRWWAIGSLAMAGAAAATLLASRAQATDVEMQVALEGTRAGRSTLNTETSDGKPTEIRFDRELKIILVPKLLDNDQILLSVELYSYDGSDFKLVSQPTLLMKNRVETALAVGLGNGETFRMTVTPRKK